MVRSCHVMFYLLLVEILLHIGDILSTENEEEEWGEPAWQLYGVNHSLAVTCKATVNVGSPRDFTPDTVPAWKTPGDTRRGPLQRDSAFSQCHGRKEEGGFQGPRVRSHQCDCISVHENSAPCMPLPPHSPCPHCIPSPTSSPSAHWVGMRRHFCLLKNETVH